MARVLFLVLVLLSSNNSWAHPAVGDRAKSSVVVTTPGSAPVQYLRTYELLEKSPVDGRFLMKTTDLDGERSEWLNAEVFESQEQIDQIMKDCCDIGGTKTQVTVPAGTFEACRFHHRDRDQNNTVWVGKVPFGMIRYEGNWKATGQREVYELLEFVNGQ